MNIIVKRWAPVAFLAAAALLAGTLSALAENGAAASSASSASLTILGPAPDSGFPEYYIRLSREERPALVTADSALWVVGKLSEQMAAATEAYVLLPLLEEALPAMVAECDRLALTTSATAQLSGAVRRARLYLWTAQLLLKPDATPPGDLAADLKTELARIVTHKGFEFSSVLDQKMDYSQMAPRGYYAQSDPLRRYFLVQMWLGRSLFRFEETHPEMAGLPLDHPALMGGWFEGSDCAKAAAGDQAELAKLARRFPQEGKDELRAAAMVAICAERAKADGGTAKRALRKVNESLAFFNGEADDTSLEDLFDAFDQTYKRIPSPQDLADETALLRLAAWLRGGKAPAIDSTGLGRRGVCLVGQRAVYDSRVFQELVAGDEWPARYSGAAGRGGGVAGRGGGAAARKGGDPFTLAHDSARGPIRGFPRGLDVMAAAGNNLALDTLKTLGDCDYDGYDKRMAKAREGWAARFSMGGRGLKPIYDYLLQAATLAATDAAPPRWPGWMRSAQYQRLRLNTGLAFWASLRHDAILRAKQSYTGAPKELRGPESGLPRGMVEPREDLYLHLGDVVTRLAEFCKTQGEAMPRDFARNAASLGGLISMLAKISEEQSKGPASEESLMFISKFGDTLRDSISLSEEVRAQTGFDPNEPVARAADVHTRAPECVEEACGPIWEIRVGQGETAVSGPVLSYYEFKQKMQERLTDETWRALLEAKSAPEPLLLQGSGPKQTKSGGEQ